MSLHLTHETVVAGYELLRTTLPFRRWKLPHPDELEFAATPLPDNDQGELCRFNDGRYRITVNPNRHKTLRSMLETLAHEMVHLRQDSLKARDSHGRVFQALADQVCRHHVFDRGQF